jgi:hypothetical protein
MQAFHFAKKKPPKETKHVPEKESCQARNIPNLSSVISILPRGVTLLQITDITFFKKLKA